jgi:hypothetical protein
MLIPNWAAAAAPIPGAGVEPFVDDGVEAASAPGDVSLHVASPIRHDRRSDRELPPVRLPSSVEERRTWSQMGSAVV